jgi:photosystem II stability/assembly factor-like uncharacterized protein
VLVAGTAGGALFTTADAGATWTAGDSPSGIWISSAASGSGDRIFAVQYGTGMYTSTDRGRSWRQVTSSPLVYSPNGINFEAVSVSRDGLRVAAAIQNGRIVLSDDAGATWRVATLPDAPQERWWRWLDSSSDGRVIVAVSHNGEVYRSSDTGATWKAVTVSVGTPTAAVSEHWYRVKVSADGSTLAIVANSFGGGPGTGIYVSRDGGSTWTKGFSLVADFTFLAMSGDGLTIGATVSNTGSTPGRVLLSTDGGRTFADQAMPGTDTNWRAMAMSTAGDRMAAAAGGFNTQSTGLLYTRNGAAAPAPAPAPSPAPTPAPAPAPAPAPTCNPPVWNTTTRYMPGDQVMRNTTMYVATEASASAWNVNGPPEWTPSYWSVTSCSAPAPAPAPAPTPAPAPAPAPSPAPAPAPAPSCSAPAWNQTTRYMGGDRVLRNGTLYTATAQSDSVWNVNSPPEWTPSYWSATGCP